MSLWAHSRYPIWSQFRSCRENSASECREGFPVPRWGRALSLGLAWKTQPSACSPQRLTTGENRPSDGEPQMTNGRAEPLSHGIHTPRPPRASRFLTCEVIHFLSSFEASLSQSFCFLQLKDHLFPFMAKTHLPTVLEP